MNPGDSISTTTTHAITDGLIPINKGPSCINAIYSGREWADMRRYTKAGACFLTAITIVTVLATLLGTVIFSCSKVPDKKYHPDPLCSEIDRHQQPKFYVNNCRMPKGFENENREKCYDFTGALGGIGTFAVSAFIVFRLTTLGIKILRSIDPIDTLPQPLTQEIEKQESDDDDVWGLHTELPEKNDGDTVQ